MIVMKKGFYDCLCSFGDYVLIPRFGEILTAKQLLAEMDHFGIEKAIVTYLGGGKLDREELARSKGEELLSSSLKKEIEDEERIDACLRVIPEKNNNGLKPDALKEGKVRAVSLHPMDDMYPLSDWVVGDLFKRLGRLRMITLLHLGAREMHGYTGMGERMVDLLAGNYRSEGLYWDKVHELASKHPNVPLVFARLSGDGGRYRKMRHMLLEKHENVYFELSCVHYLDAIEEMVEAHGPERLLFGSGMPFQDSGQAIAQLTYADISRKDRELIAHGNLERLVREEEF